MHKRLLGIAAAAVMIVTACGGATTSSAPPASSGSRPLDRPERIGHSGRADAHVPDGRRPVGRPDQRGRQRPRGSGQHLAV